MPRAQGAGCQGPGKEGCSLERKAPAPTAKPAPLPGTLDGRPAARAVRSAFPPTTSLTRGSATAAAGSEQEGADEPGQYHSSRAEGERQVSKLAAARGLRQGGGGRGPNAWAAPPRPAPHLLAPLPPRAQQPWGGRAGRRYARRHSEQRGADVGQSRLPSSRLG